MSKDTAKMFINSTLIAGRTITIDGKLTVNVLKGRSEENEVPQYDMDNYDEYRDNLVDLGHFPEQGDTRSGWMMQSPATRRQRLVAQRAELAMLHARADTRYEHYLRLVKLRAERGIDIPPVYGKEGWEANSLAYKVGVIANLEELLNLPPSRWTADTPDSDVVAW